MFVQVELMSLLAFAAHPFRIRSLAVLGSSRERGKVPEYLQAGQNRKRLTALAALTLPDLDYAMQSPMADRI